MDTVLTRFMDFMRKALGERLYWEYRNDFRNNLEMQWILGELENLHERIADMEAPKKKKAKSDSEPTTVRRRQPRAPRDDERASRILGPAENTDV